MSSSSILTDQDNPIEPTRDKPSADTGMAIPVADTIVASTFNDPEFRKAVMAGVMRMDNKNAQDAIKRFEAIVKYTANG